MQITRDVDGTPKTFEKTYHSEQDLQNDQELQEFIGEANKLSLLFDDEPQVFQWSGDSSAQHFFFSVDDDVESIGR